MNQRQGSSRLEGLSRLLWLNKILILKGCKCCSYCKETVSRRDEDQVDFLRIFSGTQKD